MKKYVKYFLCGTYLHFYIKLVYVIKKMQIKSKHISKLQDVWGDKTVKKVLLKRYDFMSMKRFDYVEN